jgi:hypothetical protein
MKKIILFAVIMVCALQMSVYGDGQAGGRNFGLGLELGDYSGLTGKLWLSNVNALSAGLGFGTFTRVYLDVLWHDFSVFKVNEGRLPLFYGFGGILNTNRVPSSNFGVRGTIGLTYIFKDNNVDIFFQLSPTYRFDPDNGIFLSGSVGVRYFFM